MGSDANALRWDRTPGHYEVYYVSLTDAASGCGAWIRYTMLAPLRGEPTCALWFMAMEPSGGLHGRKQTLAIDRLQTRPQPFELTIGDARLDEHGMRGGFDDVAWDLRWEPRLAGWRAGGLAGGRAGGRAGGPPYKHVHPLLERAKIAKTVLTLPHPDLEIAGTLRFAGRELELHGAHGGQAHLWGSKHAARWAWAHCNDFQSASGAPAADSFIDAVSVFVPRFGRTVGPSTPIVARLLGEDFVSISPLAVLRTPSEFSLTDWRFTARAGKRRIAVEVDASRDALVGVTYHDPDGDLAYCYNSEIARMRVEISDRAGNCWKLRETLVADGGAHFEYAQREPVGAVALLVK
jgi:hypothetical protein